MTITVIGHGYVGLVTACVFADLGNTVYVIGRDEKKLEKLAKSDPIIFEPGLAELLKKNIKAKRLIFTKKYDVAIPASSVVFIAVGTPSKANGEAELSAVFSVAENTAKHLSTNYTVISCKSTVPVGTNRIIERLVKKTAPSAQFDTASCPEFLREGSALQDTFSPDRIIIGADSKHAVDMLLKLHEPLDGKRVIVGLESTELIKYASNSILSTKISFANLIALLCEKSGADVEEVLDGVGLDKRIGRIFMNPGVGYGGSCFPKDVRALIKTGHGKGIDMSLLSAVEDINKQAQQNFVAKVIKHAQGKKLAVWGLSFKPNTDDVRDAPSHYVIRQLLNESFTVTAYDPEAMANTRRVLGSKISYADSPYGAVKDAEALLILTEWNEFKQINLNKVYKLLKKPLVIDGRNIYDPQTMKKKGFTYISVGR